MQNTTKHKKVYLLTASILLLILVMTIFVGCTTDANKTQTLKAAFSTQSRSELQELSAPQAAAKAMPSVVGILNYAKAGDISPQSEGSGVIMTADGYIITNAHVVEGAAEVKVVMHDGSVYTANSDNISSDTYTDLALVKVKASKLVAAEFGMSDELLVAEDVMAIGNPGGLQFSFSVTKGIVSSLNRQYEPVSGSGYVVNTIQTDAAINPGNSGGALINMYGQVVGINSAKIADVDVEGMGFSITIDDAQPILSELLTNGYVSGRAAIGVTGALVNATIKENNITKTIVGLYIQSISNSSVSDGGVKAQDIITEINGVAINSTGAAAAALKDKSAGDSIKITVYTLGERYGTALNSYYNATSRELKITLIELKPN